MFKYLATSVVLALCSFHAGAQVIPPALDRPIDFAQDVHPIFAEHCGSCHMGDARKGGLSLDSRDALLEGSEYGPAVKEGASGESRLIEVVAGLDPDTLMPPKGPQLNENQIGILRAWIDQGLPWDLAVAGHDTYIAPLKLQSVQPPDPARPVDGFIEAYLAQQGLAIPAAVDDATFARRVYLDAIGLLPTPLQLAMFLDSPAPDKRARLVDHLLKKDQQYAEHWMTFWNDLLRNDFEGTGYIDGGREQITPWLYNALYDNMPYDEFVTELIDPGAGANGFIKGIIWRGVVAAVQQPAVQAAQNVSQVFLGVNLKCASCHDSFIDHWKLADAYGLTNAFSEEPMEMVRCEVPTGDMAEYKFLWDELGGIPQGTLDERRARVAELTTAKENGHFARTIVNRMWAKFLGRGFVEPLEGIEGKPWHPELLDWLAQDFIDHGYDLKHLMRRILTSQAYQMPSVAEAPDYTTDYVFKGPYPRRLSAEQFYDALATLTDTWLPTPKFPLPGVPEADQALEVRAWRTSADTLMRALGRPNREMVVSRRDSEATTLQLLELTHGHDLHAFIDRAAEKLAGGEEQAAELIRYLYEHGLQREPSAEELQIAQSMTGTPVSPEGVEDLLWALAMLPEFQYVY